MISGAGRKRRGRPWRPLLPLARRPKPRESSGQSGLAAEGEGAPERGPRGPGLNGQDQREPPRESSLPSGSLQGLPTAASPLNHCPVRRLLSRICIFIQAESQEEQRSEAGAHTPMVPPCGSCVRCSGPLGLGGQHGTVPGSRRVRAATHQGLCGCRMARGVQKRSWCPHRAPSPMTDLSHDRPVGDRLLPRPAWRVGPHRPSLSKTLGELGPAIPFGPVVGACHSSPDARLTPCGRDGAGASRPVEEPRRLLPLLVLWLSPRASPAGCRGYGN